MPDPSRRKRRVPARTSPRGAGPVNRPISIFLAGDRGVLHDALRRLLEAEPGFAVAGEASDGRAAVRMVERLRPDVLVLDLGLQGLGGLEVARRLRDRSPGTRVVVLTDREEVPFVHAALEAGASAYVPKAAGAPDLVRAIREAAADRRFLSPPISERAVADYARKARRGAPEDAYATLTPREREIHHLAAEGKSSTTIGWLLGISPRTVEAHRAKVMAKLGVRNRTELIRDAIRRGILPSDGPRRADGHRK